MASVSAEVEAWTHSQVAEWLTMNDFPQEVVEQFQEHGVTGEVLLSLSEDDLGQMGIKFGTRRKLSLRIAKLKPNVPRPSDVSSLAPSQEASLQTATREQCGSVMSKGELHAARKDGGSAGKCTLQHSLSAPAAYKSQRVRASNKRVL